MNYSVITTQRFEKDLKHYIIKKGCLSLVSEIRDLQNKLENGEFVGKEIKGLSLPKSENSYKIRIADSTHKIGTRGGFRLIYYVVKNEKEIYLLTIYSKRDKEDIPKKELIKMIKTYCE